jgi:hypothetical protein
MSGTIKLYENLLSQFFGVGMAPQRTMKKTKQRNFPSINKVRESSFIPRGYSIHKIRRLINGYWGINGLLSFHLFRNGIKEAEQAHGTRTV